MLNFQTRRTYHAKSNTERQREFRQRNPGYYGRLHRQRKASLAAYSARCAAIEAILKPRVPLMLPAPVETIEIPGMTTIGETLVASPVQFAR